MPDYHRIYIPGGTYFFTLVTYNRLPILTTLEARNILHAVWENVRNRFPFTTLALCLMPEHLHCIWSLPEGESNYSLRWSEIKRLFSRRYLENIGPGVEQNASHIKRKEAMIWQRRFWMHVVYDERDLHNHIDYIHYNPVKHGLVTRAADWKWSTFHRFVSEGLYENDWGEGIEKQSMMKLHFGE